MKGNTKIYYDEESDYLEIFLKNKSPTYGDVQKNGVTIFRKSENDEIVGIGILDFKHRTKSFKDVTLPFNVDFSNI